MKKILLVAAALYLSGCFAYVPVPPNAPPPKGTAVRVRLATPADYRLARYTANDVVEVEGEVIRAEQDRLLLSAFGMRSAADFEFVAEGETVAIPNDQLASFERKKVSVFRSALLVVAVAALGSLVKLALDTAGGGGEGGGGGGTAQ
ncbi:MAG: hypothetical protein P8099_06505 [Gemmatimonadota bacterium]|jgi:hypothetical protein